MRFEIGRVSLAERAVVIVEPQVAWMPMARDEQSGQPSPLKSATAALKVQPGGPLMPAAAAWSVIVTGTGDLGGGVLGGGLGRADTRRGWHGRNRRSRPGGERHRPRGAGRLFDERARPSGPPW